MRISILDLTEHPLPLLEGLPTVGAQISAWLGPALPEAALTAHSINSEAAPLPEVGDFDGLVVSGSELGVYDDVAWQAPLRRLLLEVRDAGKPVFGICFGHQIMADVYGGKAELADKGTVVGARRFSTPDGEVDAHVWHKDQVTRVPPGARVTMFADHCPVGGLDYDFPARSVQFHPEYSESHLRELFARGRDLFLSGYEADGAITSFEGAQVRRDLMAHEVAGFFRQHAHAET